MTHEHVQSEAKAVKLLYKRLTTAIQWAYLTLQKFANIQI